jgi:hypothetical protein
MATLDGARIFTVGRTVYVWEDVVLAAHLWGDWSALEQRARDGLACLARLDDAEDEGEDDLDEDEVEAAGTEFRYQRDLIAAADLEAWLEARGLTVDGWLDFIRRSLLLARWAQDLDEIRETYELDDDEVSEAVLCEAMCGGAAQRLTERLAARAAIHARLLDDADLLDVDPDTLASVAALAGDEGLERALPHLSRDERRQRLEELQRLEAAWQRFAARVAPPDALRKVITTRGLDWMRLTGQAVVASDEELAREIALCVREDGRPLDDVATEAELRCETIEWWLDEVEPVVRDALIGAQPGELVGPVSGTQGHLVLNVVDKRLPSEDDAVVRARAEHALLARTVEHELANRVVWHRTL